MFDLPLILENFEMKELRLWLGWRVCSLQENFEKFGEKDDSIMLSRKTWKKNGRPMVDIVDIYIYKLRNFKIFKNFSWFIS